MAQAKHGDTVKVHYTGKFDDGTVFDSSTGRDPLEFTIDQGQVIPGFEEAVVGMNLGESKIVTIPSDQAYGPRREEMVVQVEKNQLPEDVKPEVGDRLQLVQADGQAFIVEVTDIDDSNVTLDANHPLAGKDLVFEVELVEVG